jgi:hypothetical protein
MDRQADREVPGEAATSGVMAVYDAIDGMGRRDLERIESHLQLRLFAMGMRDRKLQNDPIVAEIDRIPSHVVWKPTLDL